jgi:hypothetical protein
MIDPENEWDLNSQPKDHQSTQKSAKTKIKGKAQQLKH